MFAATECDIAKANCGSPWSQTFNYDIFGNLSKSGTQSFQPTYSYLTNQMTQIGSSTPTYDANGNVTNDFLHTYSWDAAGRPVTIDGVGVTYDASGRMVEQNKSGAYSEIVYTPSGAKLALMSAQSLTKAFVPLTGGSMAVYNSSGLAYYRHSDWIGTSRFASTPSRALYYDGAYAPFGESYAETGTTDRSFTGMNQDTVANLYDFPAREYGTQGRWPSPDPAGISSVKLRDPQTWNRYAYVRNNPLAATDANGMMCTDDGNCVDDWGGDGSGGGIDDETMDNGGGDGGGSGGGGGSASDPGAGNGGDDGSSCGFMGCSDDPSDPGSGNQDPGCGALSCGDPGTNSGTTNGDPGDPGNGDTTTQCLDSSGNPVSCSGQGLASTTVCDGLSGCQTTITVTPSTPTSDPPSQPKVPSSSVSPCLWADAGAFGLDVFALFQPELAPWAVSATGHALACNALWEFNP